MTPLLVSSLIFVVAIALILSEKLDRAIVSFAGAGVMVLAGHVFGFYSEEQAIDALDFETLESIELSVLVFFGGLFVIVGGLDAAGVLDRVGEATAVLANTDPLVAALALMWLVGILSALVDNVPVTVAMIPVVQKIALAGANVTPLWWALAFGAGFGGNGTIIGSTANVVVVDASRRTQEPVRSPLWNRRGLPVMLLTLTIASVAMAAAFSWFE